MNLTIDQIFKLSISELYRVGKSGMLVVKDLNRGRKIIKKKFNKYGFNMYDFDVSGFQRSYYCLRFTRYKVVKKRGPNSTEYSEPDINMTVSIPKEYYKGIVKVSILKRNNDFIGSYEKFVGWEETLEGVVRDRL